MDQSPPPRKRSLPIGVRSKRLHVSLPPATVSRLRERVRTVIEGGHHTDVSKEIARCVEEADGVLRRLQRPIRAELYILSVRLSRLQGSPRSDHSADLAEMAEAVNAIHGLLDPALVPK